MAVLFSLKKYFGYLEVIPVGEVNTPALPGFNSNLKKTEIGINYKQFSSLFSLNLLLPILE